MRHLYIHRQRALACFAVSYHCVLGQSPEAHLQWAASQDRKSLMTAFGPGSMRNGETVCLETLEEESSIFVIAYLEQRSLMTQTLPIPAGHEDLHFTVLTRYDGNRRLSLELVNDGPRDTAR